MKKSNLRATAALQVLAMLGAGLTSSMIASAPASAQDYTSGAIIATVTNGSGAPVAGANVSIRSLTQNQVRTFVTSSSGSFSASGLTPGEYAITVAAPGYQPYNDSLTITAAQESRVTVGLVSITESSTIVVTGRRLRQTATGGTTGLNVDVAAVNANAPIEHSITALTLLAPTAQRGVSAFGDVPSVGGSSVAENAYYINGLNITNPDTYIGSARVPFYFYKSVDVQTGGYAAEFGRATGAVINATTKSGSNDPFIAMHVDWEPKSLQSHSPNVGNPIRPSDIGRLNRSDSKELTVEAGGAIIPDHLFVYGMIQPRRNTTETASASTGTFERQKDNDPFYGGKIDAYINPTQHAEFTIFDTRSTTQISDFAFTPNSTFDGGTIGASKGTEVFKSGGLNWVGRYTGDITNFFTLSGAYGISKDRGDTLPTDPSAYQVFDSRSGTAVLISKQPFGSQTTDQTRRRFYRADADLRFNAAGHHHVRFGFDNEDLSETKITQLNGAQPIAYTYTSSGILLTYERLGGHVSANDAAFYAEDSWNTPLNGLTLNFGIRDDIFRQTDLSGQRYLNFKNNIGPRLAFSYVPDGQDKWKFFGSFGRYFIPPAMNLGFRGKDLYFSEQFDYPSGNPSTGAGFTGFDAVTGLPTGPIGPAQPGSAGGSNCPIDISSAPGNPVNAPGSCAIFGAGVQNPAIAKVVPGTKATYEDEFILGTRYQANKLLSFGVNATYRKLKRVSEDTDFAPQLAAYWCDSSHFDASRCDFYSNNSSYYIWNVNPTTSLTVNDWVAGINGQVLPVTLTKGFHFPTPKRDYKAVVLDFNRADDGKWLASGSVTWSKLRGNTEGTVKSDAGNNAQEDAGSTQDFDYLGLSDNSYGLLPNDHRWAFKLFGAYHFNKYFTLGANIYVQSPMHGSCLGYHPRFPQPDVADYSYAYGARSNFCGSGPLNANGKYTTFSPAQRGTGWKSEWMKQINLSARFNIPYGDTDQKKITIRADVFNVFNSHAVIQRNGRHEISRSGSSRTCTGALECTTPNPLYLTPLYYQKPRFVRLGLDIAFGGHRSAPVEFVAPPPPPPPVEAPATQTCVDGTVILATGACPVPPAPPPPPPPPPPSTGERG